MGRDKIDRVLKEIGETRSGEITEEAIFGVLSKKITWLVLVVIGLVLWILHKKGRIGSKAAGVKLGLEGDPLTKNTK